MNHIKTEEHVHMATVLAPKKENKKSGAAPTTSTTTLDNT
jgi:hypothetical protein